jgi:hypothetical protein
MRDCHPPGAVPSRYFLKNAVTKKQRHLVFIGKTPWVQVPPRARFPISRIVGSRANCPESPASKLRQNKLNDAEVSLRGAPRRKHSVSGHEICPGERFWYSKGVQPSGSCVSAKQRAVWKSAGKIDKGAIRGREIVQHAGETDEIFKVRIGGKQKAVE